MIQPLPTPATDAVAWIVIALFLSGWFLRDRFARSVTAVAWGLFAVFWLLLVPRFALVMRSPIETVLSALAVPACLYAGYLIWSGRDTLFTLSRAVAIMGLLYLPFETIEPLRQGMVEIVARQVYLTIVGLGFDVALVDAPDSGYRAGLLFTTGGEQYLTHIVLACTGIGSISIFGGLIAALDAPLVRKVQAFGLATVVIYVLNIARNAFIAVAFGEQWFQWFVDPVMAATGYAQPGLVSFFIADRVISQSLSVVALVGITYLVVRIVPELLSVVEEALYVVLRSEYDLHAAFAIDDRR